MGTHSRKTRLDTEALEDMLQLLSEASEEAQQVSEDLQRAIRTFSALQDLACRYYAEAETPDPELLRASRQCEKALENAESMSKRIDHVGKLIWEVRARNYPQGRLEGMGDGQDTD